MYNNRNILFLISIFSIIYVFSGKSVASKNEKQNRKSMKNTPTDNFLVSGLLSNILMFCQKFHSHKTQSGQVISIYNWISETKHQLTTHTHKGTYARTAPSRTIKDCSPNVLHFLFNVAKNLPDELSVKNLFISENRSVLPYLDKETTYKKILDINHPTSKRKVSQRLQEIYMNSLKEARKQLGRPWGKFQAKRKLGYSPNFLNFSSRRCKSYYQMSKT